jgi:hypothetical protein
MDIPAFSRHRGDVECGNFKSAHAQAQPKASVTLQAIMLLGASQVAEKAVKRWRR